MHTGKIKKVIKERGFAFISDTDGRDVFAHRNSFDGVSFDDLKEGVAVEFEVENGPKGPSAKNVRAGSK